MEQNHLLYEHRIDAGVTAPMYKTAANLGSVLQDNAHCSSMYGVHRDHSGDHLRFSRLDLPPLNSAVARLIGQRGFYEEAGFLGVWGGSALYIDCLCLGAFRAPTSAVKGG